MNHRELQPYSNSEVAGAELSSDPVNLTTILADNSGSMSGRPIEELNAGLMQYRSDMLRDPVLQGTVMTSLFTFEGDGAKQVTPYAAPRFFNPPPLRAETDTPLCQSIMQVVDATVHCRAVMRSVFDRDSRRSWMFIVTDAGAGDREHAAGAQRAMRCTAVENQIDVFFIGCGDHVDMNFLNYLAQPGRKPRHMRSVENFAAFFRWLYESQVMKSTSRADERLRLPPTKLNQNHDCGWEDDSWSTTG
jgi:uncharacterized protein YegL